MADITRRRTGELLHGLFSILLRYPEGLQAAKALEELEEAVPPTPYELGHFDSGGRRFEKIIRLATVDCTKARWLVKSHGIWTITDEGRVAHQTMKDPEQFYRRAVQLYQEWRKSTEVDGSVSTDPEPTPDPVGKTASITFEQAEEQAWSR